VTLPGGFIGLDVIELAADPRQDDRDLKIVLGIRGFQQILGERTRFG
jgi:hypothetical protein